MNSPDPLSLPHACKGQAEVTASALRVRGGPGPGYAQIGRLLVRGEVVDVWAAGGVWWLVQAADGLTGWSHSEWLQAVGTLRP
jgi:N-acetylmuramoyl-L-alanine amidase